MQALDVVSGSLAGFAGPGALALRVAQARPGEHVVVGQVQVRGVHRKLADELQQAGQTVQQPLGERERGTDRQTDRESGDYKSSPLCSQH